MNMIQEIETIYARTRCARALECIKILMDGSKTSSNQATDSFLLSQIKWMMAKYKKEEAELQRLENEYISSHSKPNTKGIDMENAGIPTLAQLEEIVFNNEVEYINRNLRICKLFPATISTWSDADSIHQRAKLHLESLGYTVNLEAIGCIRNGIGNVPVIHYIIGY